MIPNKHTAPEFAYVGHSPRRPDGLNKARGLTRYVDDLNPSGCLYARVVTSPCACGVIKKLDVQAARSLPGVLAVITALDFPWVNQIGIVKPDQPLLALKKVRWHGDRLALIAAETKEIAAEAAGLVQVEIVETPGVFDPVAALESKAPLVHPDGNLAAHMLVRKGDLKKARTQADIIIEQIYTTGHQEHAYLETNGILALPQSDGSIILQGSMQCPFYVQKIIARLLGLPHAKVRVIQMPTGGAFGGKEDYPSEPAACAAVLAASTGRPVKIILSREEDMAWSTKRHATVIKHTLMAKKDGSLIGIKAQIYVDAGAYLGLSAIVAERSNASVAGPYAIPNVEVDTYTVYTNNPFGGAFRGFGAPQVTFALESQMELLAQKLELDPIELRLKNLLKRGSKTAYNDTIKETPAAQETIELALTKANWNKKYKAFAKHNATKPEMRKGIGICPMWYGCCLHAGGQHLEGSAALVQVHPDASVSVQIGGTEIGQGAFTAMALIAAEKLGLPFENIRVLDTDTLPVPDSGPTVASRTTIMSGNAVLDACAQIQKRLLQNAATKLGKNEKTISFKIGQVYVGKSKTKLTVAQVIADCFAQKFNLTAAGWYAPKRKKWDRKTGNGEAYTLACFGTMIAEVTVDTITGLVKVDHITAVSDVGQAIFRDGVIGQLHGGITQGLGLATMENLALKNGKILNPNFTDYLLPTSLDIPTIDIALIEKPYLDGPFGAKGIGEPSLIPVAPAIANAVAHALGVRLFDLPLTPERVKLAFEKAENETR